MKTIISNNTNIPIYEQIKKTIIEQILSNELEEEGYIITRHGKGSFVVPKNLEIVKEQYQKEIEKKIIEIIECAKKINIDKTEIIDLFMYLYGEE